jgi:hypothetical protein
MNFARYPEGTAGLLRQCFFFFLPFPSSSLEIQPTACISLLSGITFAVRDLKYRGGKMEYSPDRPEERVLRQRKYQDKVFCV